MSNPGLGYGIQVACAAMHWPECLDIARAGDELGYAYIGVPDHYVATPDGTDPSPTLPLLEGWTTLGAMAQATSQIRMGPFVASNTFRHPAIFAKMAASLDHVSGGRIEAGIGIGWFDLEHTCFGIPFDETPHRLSAMEEGIRVIQALWTQPEVSFEGKFYTIHKAIAEPKPLQNPMPLVVASSGPKVGLRITAQYATHWNAYRTAADWANCNRLLDEHCERLRRDPAEITRSVMIPVYLEENDAVRAKIDMFGDREWFLIGNDEEIRDRIGRFVEAGAEQIIVQIDAPNGNVETLQQFADRFF